MQEYARIQQFPDDWIFCGSMADKYKQIGNAVPVGLGEAVGRAIIKHIAGKIEHPPEEFPFSRYKETDEVSWEVKTRAIMGIGAKPESRKRSCSGKTKVDTQQLSLGFPMGN